MRGPRLEFPGALYHVFTRGNNRAPVFDAAEEYGRFRSSLGRAVEEFRWIVHAFALMPNHIHFMVELTEANLSRGMHWLLSGYSHVRNLIRGKVGHVFGGRFRAILCETETYRLELVRYIHMNPVAAGLVDDPRDWPWSSHRCYVGLESIPWLATEPVLECFGSPEDPRRKERFHEFVVDRSARTDAVRQARLERGWVLGSEAFIEAMKRKLGSPVRQVDRDRHPRPSLTEIAEQIAQEGGASTEELKVPGRIPWILHARGRFVRTAVREFSYRGSEVAKFLNRDKACISRVLKRAGG